MKAFIHKHWFLLLVAAGIGLIVHAPEMMRWTAWLDPSLCGSIAVLLSAWSLETRRLHHAATHPGPALWATVISYGLLPVMSLLAGWPLATDFRIGLLLVSAVPCTLASAVIWTRMAGGDEATALFIVLLTNCTSWLVTTAWLTLGIGSITVRIDPLPLMSRLLLVLVLPVGLGQLLRTSLHLRQFATRHQTVLSVVARLLTMAIMCRAALEVRDRLGQGAHQTGLATLGIVVLLCLAMHLAALAGGLWSSRLLRFDRPKQIAVAIAGSQKTLPVSLILFDAHFTAYPLAVLPLVFYHFGQLIADTFIANRLAGRPATPKELPEDEVL